MKQVILVVFVCTISIISMAQDVGMVSAKIIDTKTNVPIEFVNVGFVGKGIGTISNSEGSFYLVYELDDIDRRDVLQISAIGYETQTVAFSELKKYSSYKTPIFLTPKAYNLDQVIVKSVQREEKVLGHPDVTAFNMGYWRNAEGLGGEIASVIRIQKRNTKLLNLKFKIIENLSDSLLVRVNVYDYERGVPGKNILTQNIFHTVSRKKGLETIDLEDYNIIVDDDVVASLELVEVYGTAIYFSLSASAYGGLSFTREISQDDWKIYKKVGMGFSLDSSFPAKGRDKAIASRPRPEKIHLYWDTSIQLQDRNIKEELKLLKKYLQTVDNVEIVVDKFSNQMYDRRVFACYKGKCQDLLDYLESSNYNGAANYESLLQDNTIGADMILTFTDGNSFFGPLATKINVPTFLVNSMKNAANESLQNLAFNSGGIYLNLDKISPQKALDYLLFEIEDVSVYSKQEGTAEDFYYGVVYNEAGPIRDALLRIRGSFQEVRTKSNGSYKIMAEPEDVMEIEALGMISKDTLLGAFRKTHIPMKANREVLSEVVVAGKIEKETFVETPFGKKKKNAVGYSTLQTYTKKDISPDEITLADILRSKPGIIVEGFDNINVKFRFKKTNMATLQDGGKTFPALVIDGLIYDQRNQSVPYIDTQTIESITLLKSNLSTIKYGQLAAYGAIVIETSNSPDAVAEKEKEKSALAQGNEYTETLSTLEEARTATPKSSYFLALESCSSFEEAKLLYYKQLKCEKNNLEYFVTTATYFERWNSDFSNTIRSNIAAIAPKNISALKILAYESEKTGDLKKAQFIYEQIINLGPNLAQSYRDLAQIYVRTGAYKLAGSLYKQMIYNTIPNVDFIDFQDVLLNEFQHLIKNHKSSIDFEGLPTELLSLDFKQDIRIIFEWNLPGIQFEVQFVNPDNKFYTFSHNTLQNKELLELEISDGFFMKEFVIDDGEKGEWLINIRDDGTSANTVPLVLKYTRYRNYGLPNEEKTVKIISLNDISEKVTLDSFLNRSD
jgi:tetratricopeptide (TPR) repeat protein